jgi:hypothetical protein
MCLTRQIEIGGFFLLLSFFPSDEAPNTHVLLVLSFIVGRPSGAQVFACDPSTTTYGTKPFGKHRPRRGHIDQHRSFMRRAKRPNTSFGNWNSL